MKNQFVSVNNKLPNNFDLCDVKLHSNKDIIIGVRFIQYDNGHIHWYKGPRNSPPNSFVSHWRLNEQHTNVSAEEWLASFPKHHDDSLGPLDEIENIIHI